MNEKAWAAWLIRHIEAFDTIVLFRHVLADGDALGAQFGLKAWINARWPQKKVAALGESAGACKAFYPDMDELSDDSIREALAIVLDTSNAARIDDDRWQYAKQVIRIDHHLLVESYCEEALVDETAAATCELIAVLLAANEEVLTPVCAQYLYSGLIADTINFTISSTTARTLRSAAYLLGFGVDIVRLQMEHFATSLHDFRYESWLRANASITSGIGYIIADQEDYARFGMSFPQAKEKVFVLGGIREVKIWALFTQMDDEEEKRYACSLRSRDIALDDIARSYGGGGHRCACGIKHLSVDQVDALIEKLKERVREVNEEQ